MKRYLMLLAEPPGGWDPDDEEQVQAVFAAHDAFEAYVAEHGRRVASAALAEPATATTVRHVEGRQLVSDGPFAETAEVVGGYYDVELPDLDHAIAAASLLPASYAVEIRPTMVIEGYEQPDA